MSTPCKTRDGQHILGDNGRCLVCWQFPDPNQFTKVMVIVISAEDSEAERVLQYAQIIEAQIRGVFNTMSLIQAESRQIDPSRKLVDLQVYQL